MSRGITNHMVNVCGSWGKHLESARANLASIPVSLNRVDALWRGVPYREWPADTTWLSDSPKEPNVRYAPITYAETEHTTTQESGDVGSCPREPGSAPTPSPDRGSLDQARLRLPGHQLLWA
jgi:hypothetical protein